MTKFMVLYNNPLSASDVMANATPEEMKTSMEEWIKWKDAAVAGKTVKIEFGMPLQIVSRILPKGTEESDTQVSGYSIIEADSKDIIEELLKTHPHLKHDGASIDVLEMLSMPGIN